MLLYGVAEVASKKVQLVQNAAARLVTGAWKFDHITPVLRELCWLPVKQRIIFKIGVIMFKCVSGVATDYLGSLCAKASEVSSRSRLRSRFMV